MSTPNHSSAPRAAEPRARRTRIGDIAAVGEVLPEEQLRLIDGGAVPHDPYRQTTTNRHSPTQGGKDSCTEPD
jgi:hypothetical protein